ncbi:Peptide-methionine (S)-S-oxide reductase MsrA [hydrothermal vent metagenome]|uniref:peptide-methionine (S)-S-oxide reductase n=1 Tax=hydrothermal vent metagenome TaxID=652676 RepID=A0A3B0W7M5_9ZZZZ
MKPLLIFALSLISSPLFAGTTQTNEATSDQQETAIFAGGCFWCMEPPFDKLDGVISTISGYTSGHKKNPTYREVSAGRTGHTEAIQIVFNPNKVTYVELLEVFWKNIDPVAVNRQFCDSGSQYRSGIYYLDKTQEKAAKQSLQQLEQNKPFHGSIATELVAASAFYPAEDYHQDYYQKNPLRYKYYRYSCGRGQKLEEIWGNK